MNQQGRHYRDPNFPDNPTCDYEAKGSKCDFFEVEEELAALPYPSDVSLGPVPTPVPAEGPTELAQLMNLLQQQKADNDQKFAFIQRQVEALAQSQAGQAVTSAPQPFQGSVTLSQSIRPIAAAPSTTFSQAVTFPQTPVHNQSSVAMPTASQTFPGSLPSSRPVAPSQVSNAAAALNAQMSVNLGPPQAAYQPLNMGQLRSDPQIAMNAERLLQNNIQNVPPLNPWAAHGAPASGVSQVSTVDQLYAATMRNKQLKAFEFAQTGQFSYRSQIKQENINAILFAYGSFKHLEAVKLGLIQMPDDEFLARLRHLKNVFEVACLSSNIAAYADNSWQVAREYDTRVISDIESGSKMWTTMSKGLETDAIYCANQIVENRNKAKKLQKDSKDPKDLKKSRETKSKPCTTFNTHRASEGCYWEHNNRGETCIFEHFCSWCKTNRDVKEKHKVLDCTHKPE